MKVYILTEFTQGEEFILGVFDKPKSARKYFDILWNLNTRKKWKKVDDSTRTFKYGDRVHYVTEWVVQGNAS